MNLEPQGKLHICIELKWAPLSQGMLHHYTSHIIIVNSYLYLKLKICDCFVNIDLFSIKYSWNLSYDFQVVIVLSYYVCLYITEFNVRKSELVMKDLQKHIH